MRQFRTSEADPSAVSFDVFIILDPSGLQVEPENGSPTCSCLLGVHVCDNYP